ncbi:Alpha/Beta hydrolase protein, partial [Baffinella frigidus]
MSNDPGAWWSTFSKENSILNQFLFPAPPPSYSWSSFPGELVCIVGRQGNVVPCTIMPGFGVSNDKSKQDGQLDPASVLVIYCHANGEDIGVLNEAGHWLSDTLGVHVLIPEYPGYGMAPGRPNELSVNSNIEAAYEFAVNGLHWDPKSIILFGRSIGTGPAIKLAAERECGGVILVSPYTSVKDMVSKHAGFLTSWLTAELANMFPSEDTIGRVQCPTLIVHGATDRVIPSDQ